MKNHFFAFKKGGGIKFTDFALVMGGLALGLNVRPFVCWSFSGDFFTFSRGKPLLGVFCF